MDTYGALVVIQFDFQFIIRKVLKIVMKYFLTLGSRFKFKLRFKLTN